jgi:hypothetical protein
MEKIYFQGNKMKKGSFIITTNKKIPIKEGDAWKHEDSL